MAEIEFYDVAQKKKFKTDKFKIVQKKGRFFAVSRSPTGRYDCWRVISKDDAAKYKKAA
ncbi:hypothetical protein KY331_04565 [Candidatus Woesearchaeota archaeon]|nr:hypothetical protein [Candidatus Woesearchaeota archaeon]